jgi:putative transposase
MKWLRIGGRHMYLWRAVDDEGEVLDVLVQRRRDKAAALKLLRKLLKNQGFVPTQVTTDKLPSYGAAFDEMGLSAHYERGAPTTTGGGFRSSRSADASARCSA